MFINKTKLNKNNGNKVSFDLDITNNIVDITVILSLALIPLVFVPLGGKFDHFYLPKVIAMAVLVISFIVMMVLKKQSFKNLIKNDSINKLLCIYLILLVTSVFFASNKVLAIFGNPGRWEGLITIILYMSLFIIARSFTKLDDKFLMIVIVTACIVSIYGIMQTFGIDPFPRDVLRNNWARNAFSTMGNQNFLGSYLVLILPISIYLFVIKEKYLGVLSYVILFYCLLSTNTRGAWLGAIFCIITFAVVHFIYYRYTMKEFSKYIILFILTVSIVLVYNYNTGGALLSRFLTISSDAKGFLAMGETSDYMGSNRGFIWKRVVELIKKRPFVGYGIENLGEAFDQYYKNDILEILKLDLSVDKAHNEYLNIAVTTGVPSLIAYMSFVILIFKNGFKNVRHNFVAILLVSSVTGYLTAAFFNISVVAVAYIYWIFLGLLAGSNIKYQ
jgi:putative inorganic carbon (HCO3(-)) transporter